MSILHLTHRGHQINQFYKVPSSEALMLQTGPGDSGGCREGGREGGPPCQSHEAAVIGQKLHAASCFPCL